LPLEFTGIFKVVTFNVNGIGKQCFKHIKQVQDHHTDVALHSGTHLKHYVRFFIQNYHVYLMDCFLGLKGGTAAAVREYTT
jgi:hypothetical protein